MFISHHLEPWSSSAILRWMNVYREKELMSKWVNILGGFVNGTQSLLNLIRKFTIYRLASLSPNCDLCLWSLNLIKTCLARNNNFLKCQGLCSSEELCGEQAIWATKLGLCEPGKAALQAYIGPNIWLVLITFCPCFIPSHLWLLGPEFSPNCQGWMVSKMRLSLFPRCGGPGHGRVSFSIDKWNKYRSFSHPQSLLPCDLAWRHL